MWSIFRLTPPSRPNNIRAGNVRPSVRPSVRPYVHPQKVFFSDFNEIWYVDRVSKLEFDVPFQHKYGYIKDEYVDRGQ